MSIIKLAASGVTHTEIESCFDRFLMLRDGVEPFSFDLTSHIVPSESLADVASAYFAVAPEYALKAIRSIKRYNNLMNSKSCIARGFAVLALKLSGCYKEMHGMMMPKKDDKRCEDSNIALSDCYERAVEKSVRLIENLHAYIGGAACLSSELDRDFE